MFAAAPGLAGEVGPGADARGRKILVTYRGRQVTCELRDTLPAHPKNGAGIDLNPGAARKLGLEPPANVSSVHWRWAKRRAGARAPLPAIIQASRAVDR